jgi:hypothetical protein
MQRLFDEQNKNRYEACERLSWEIKNRLYRSLDNSQIEIQFIINSSIDVVIDTTFDVTSFDEFTLSIWAFYMSFLYELFIWAFYMSFLYELFIWAFYMSFLYELATWKFYMNFLYELATWEFYLSFLYEFAIWACYVRILYELAI